MTISLIACPRGKSRKTKNMHSIVTRWLFTVLLLIAALPANAAQNEAPENNPKPLVYVTHEIDGENIKFSSDEVSILGSHYIVVAIKNAAVGSSYDFTFVVSDGEGREVDSGTFSGQGVPGWTFVTHEVTPNRAKHKPGSWKILLSGGSLLPKASLSYGVLPGTPAELEDYALYEQARESVFRAYAQYWVAVTNHFGAKPREAFYYTSLKPSEQPANSADKLFDGAEIPKDSFLIGIGGVRYGASKAWLSLADRLNGVTYKGQAQFSFKVLRLFKNGRWTPWMDLQNVDATVWTEIHNMLGNVQAPFGMEQGFAMNYTFEQKDENWRVANDLQETFLNGKRLSKQVKTPLERPSASQARLIINDGSDPRKTDKRDGDAVKAQPEPLPTDVKNTMQILRGRPLN
jgi:hypothetical protein